MIQDEPRQQPVPRPEQFAWSAVSPLALSGKLTGLANRHQQEQGGNGGLLKDGLTFHGSTPFNTGGIAYPPAAAREDVSQAAARDYGRCHGTKCGG
jgi:hypothetical protein